MDLENVVTTVSDDILVQSLAQQVGAAQGWDNIKTGNVAASTLCFRGGDGYYFIHSNDPSHFGGHYYGIKVEGAEDDPMLTQWLWTTIIDRFSGRVRFTLPVHLN